MESKPRVVILGAGYGGILVAQNLSKRMKRAELQISLVNKHTYHQLITQLHEPAAGRNDYEDIRISIDEVVNTERVNLVKGEIVAIDPLKQSIYLKSGQELNYDYLVIALGSEPEYFNIPGLKENSMALRSLNSARLIRTHIENMMARYKAEPDKLELLTIVIGGAGFTGVEIAGELGDWLPQVCKRYDVDHNLVKIKCIEAAAQVLPGFDEELSAKAEEILASKDVELITGKAIMKVNRDGLVLSDGEEINAATVIWTGGVRGNSVVEASGFSTIRGRAEINEYLQSIDYPNVYIIGDNAMSKDEEGKVLPPTAQIAIQQGKHTAINILHAIRGEALLPFNFKNRGVVASIGRHQAVGLIGNRFKPKGSVAKILKEVIAVRYLFILGGLPLVLRKKLW